MNPGSILRAAVLGGLLGSVLVATPFLSKLNCCCCALVVLAGAFAAWVLRSDSDRSASTSRCALAGLLAGALAGVVGTPLGALLSRAAFGAAHLEGLVQEMLEVFRKAFEDSGQPVPPGFLQGMEGGLRATSGLELNAWLVLATIFSAIVFAFFGLLGGIVGALLTPRRDVAPPPSWPHPPVAGPSAAPLAASPQAGPPPAEPPPAAPPVVDADGEPHVQWEGPTLGGDSASSGVASSRDEAESAGGADSATEGERGEIPLDELPLLPPRREVPDDAPPGPGAPPAPDRGADDAPRRD